MNTFMIISLAFHCWLNVLGQEIIIQQPVEQQQPQQVVVQQPVEQQPQQVVVQQPVEQQPVVVQQQPAQQTQTVVQQPAQQTQTVVQQPVVQQQPQQNGPNYQLTGTFVLQQAQTVADPVFVLPENSSDVQGNTTDSPPSDDDYDDDGLPPLTLLLPQSRPLIYPANSLIPVYLQQIPTGQTLNPSQLTQKITGIPQVGAQQFPGRIPNIPAKSTTTTQEPSTTRRPPKVPSTTQKSPKVPSATQQPPKLPSTTQNPPRTPTYIYAPNFQQFYHPQNIIPQTVLKQTSSGSIPPQFQMVRMVSPQQLMLLRPAPPLQLQSPVRQRVSPGVLPCQVLMQPMMAQNQFQRQIPSH